MIMRDPQIGVKKKHKGKRRNKCYFKFGLYANANNRAEHRHEAEGMTIFTEWTNYCPYLSDSEHLLFRKYIRHSSALKNQSKVHASHNYYASSDNTVSNNSTPSMRYLGQIDAAFDHFSPILETYVRHFFDVFTARASSGMGRE